MNLRLCLLSGVCILSVMLSTKVSSDDTIKVGVLHSLSGTMSISETTLKDTMLMLIAQQNEKGGLLGKQLEPVVVDPASNWSYFAEDADMLIEDEGVSAIFGCWTSVSRKAVLPVVEQADSLLFYPVQYEGEESSENVFYTGAAPNQQAIPAIDYLINEHGIERWILAGTDYIYPRTTNKILAAYLEIKGFNSEDIMTNYTPFGHADWAPIVSQFRVFASEGKKTAIVSTINGDANLGFYKALGSQNISPDTLPVIAFSIGEEELLTIDAKPLVGHFAAWNYFMSIESPENSAFISKWQAFTNDSARVTNDPMEATYIGFNLWVKAVERAGTTEPSKVREAMIGLSVPNLTGGYAQMLPNHHITKPLYIGQIQADGQFNVVWQSTQPVAGDAWSDYLPESKAFIADWQSPVSCGKYNIETQECYKQD